MITDQPSSPCDLCGGGDWDQLVRLATGRAMRSDRVVVAADLDKSSCRRCGLVRSTRLPSEGELRGYYGGEYAVADADYVFHTADGSVGRTAAFCSWMSEAMGAFRWKCARAVWRSGRGPGRDGAVRPPLPAPRTGGGGAGAAGGSRPRPRPGRASAPVEEQPPASYDVVYSVAVVANTSGRPPSS